MTAKRTIIAACCAWLLASGCQSSNPDEEDVQSSVAGMIELIESGSHAELIETYFDPDDVQKFKADGTFERRVERFRDRSSERLLAALKRTQDMSPTFNEDKTVATFRIQGARQELKFRKVETRWFFTQ